MPPRLSARTLFSCGVVAIAAFLTLWVAPSSVVWSPDQFGWLANPGVQMLFWIEGIVGQVGVALVVAALLVASLGPQRPAVAEEQRGFPPRLGPEKLLGSAVMLLVAVVAVHMVAEASTSLQNWYAQFPAVVVQLVTASYSVVSWLSAGLVGAAFAVRALQPATRDAPVAAPSD